jgi:hypothetical protein
MSSFFHIVHQNVARNPIARAVQKRRLHSAMVDFKMHCYYLEEGSQEQGNYMAAAKVYAVAIRLCEVKGITEGVPLLRGAMSCCMQRAREGFKWKLVDAVALDNGLEVAEKVVNASTALEVQDALNFVTTLEAAAETL